ncbi:MAG TPA: hypothetical protein VND65_22495 [Candidatus Binatia bacterium]|nr:hypothetical protein [Candidatus Binatia bacterium]
MSSTTGSVDPPLRTTFLGGGHGFAFEEGEEDEEEEALGLSSALAGEGCVLSGAGAFEQSEAGVFLCRRGFGLAGGFGVDF